MGNIITAVNEQPDGTAEVVTRAADGEGRILQGEQAKKEVSILQKGDERPKPEDVKTNAPLAPVETPPSDQPKKPAEVEQPDYSDMKLDELKALAAERKIEFPSDATRKDLIKLLQEQDARV